MYGVINGGMNLKKMDEILLQKYELFLREIISFFLPNLLLKFLNYQERYHLHLIPIASTKACLKYFYYLTFEMIIIDSSRQIL